MSLDKIAEITARRERLYQEALIVAEKEPFELCDQLAYRSLCEQLDAAQEYLKFLELEYLEVTYGKRNRKTNSHKQAAIACSASR